MTTEQTIIKSDIDDRYFSYHGSGAELFKIFFVNLLLTAITFGIYFPWAKAKVLSYHLANLEFKGTRFAFHGTGKEMFKGFFKAYIILIALFGCIIGGQFLLMHGQYFGLLLILIAAFFQIFIIPLAIVGSARYRMSRTTWRGIHFKYTGTVKRMAWVLYKGIFFTIITFGIYGAWLMVDIIEELLSNSKIGDIQFKFTGKGGDLFWTRLAGGFLTAITFGIYVFKYQSNLRHFWLNNARMLQGERKGTLQCETTGSGMFKMIFLSALTIVFTLGLGIPWALTRQIKYFTDTTLVKGKIDYDNIQQDEVDDADSTGEGIFDMLSIEF